MNHKDTKYNMVRGKRPEQREIPQSGQQVEDRRSRREDNPGTSSIRARSTASHTVWFIKDSKSKGTFYQSCQSSWHRMGVMDGGIPTVLRF